MLIQLAYIALNDREITLMDELIKRMLSISARLSPHNGTSRVVDMRTTACHGLAIRLHVTLPKDMRTSLLL